MSGKFIASEPTPGQRITEIHIWIATYQDGTEGIIAAGFPSLGITPLMSSRRELAQKLEARACAVMVASMDSKHPAIGVRLVTFTSTEGTRQ